MPYSIFLAKIGLCLLAIAGAAFAEAPKITFPTYGSIDPQRRLVLIQINGLDSDSDFKKALPDLKKLSNWQVRYKGMPINLIEVVIDADAIARIQFREGEVNKLTSEDIEEDVVTIEYLPAKATAFAKTGTKQSKMTHWYTGCYKYTFTDDKEKALITVTGGFQAAFDAKPQYFWSAKAACSVGGQAHKGIGEFALSFVGEASAQKNADPDSLKAGIKWNRRISPTTSRMAWILIGDAFSYEFERAIKDEAVLNSDKPEIRKFLEKNSNLMWGGQVRWVTGLRKVNLTVGLAGLEAGRSLTRTVKADANSSAPQPVVRLKFDMDAYYNIYRTNRQSPVVTIHSQHTSRLPFYQEPYLRARENDGKMYLTSKARHWTLFEVGIPIAKGTGLSIQYKRGSLPPSFEFVNHQVTIGFNLLLTKP